MRLFLDESLPPQLARALRDLGFEALHAGDIGLQGASDDEIFAKAGEEDAILLTIDLDFSDVRRFPGPTPVIVLRLRAAMTGPEIVAFATTRLVRYRAQVEELKGAIMILEPRRSRIRRKY